MSVIFEALPKRDLKLFACAVSVPMPVRFHQSGHYRSGVTTEAWVWIQMTRNKNKVATIRGVSSLRFFT
jgi:hypothetical protein